MQAGGHRFEPGILHEYIMKYQYTRYFKNEVLRKRPYIKRKWCETVVENPIQVERQDNNRYRFWAWIEDLDGYLRVVTLDDKKTIHNAFPDRGFKG